MSDLSRNTANFSINGNFEVKKRAPLDNRMRVPYKTDLVETIGWYPYKGMLCEVTDDAIDSHNGLWELCGDASGFCDWQNEDHWRRVTRYRPSKQILDFSGDIMNPVGGFGAENNSFTPQVLSTFTYDQLFDILLYPTVPPIIEDPSFTVELTATDYDNPRDFYRVGSNLEFVMKFEFTGNKVHVVGNVISGSKPYSGDISYARYIDFSGDEYDLSFTPSYDPRDTFNHPIDNFTLPLSYEILPGNNSRTIILFNDGSFTPFNSRGQSINDNGDSYLPYASASYEFINNIEGVYPVFINDLSNDWEEVTQIYGLNEDIEVEHKYNFGYSGTPQPFKIAISKSRYDEIGDVSFIMYQFDNMTTDYNQATQFITTTNDSDNTILEIQNIDISVNNIDVSYVYFSTEDNSNGYIVGTESDPFKFKLSIE